MNVECDVLISAGQNQQCQSLHKTFFCVVKHILLPRLKTLVGSKNKQKKNYHFDKIYAVYCSMGKEIFLQSFANISIDICGQSVCMKFFSR